MLSKELNVCFLFVVFFFEVPTGKFKAAVSVVTERHLTQQRSKRAGFIVPTDPAHSAQLQAGPVIPTLPPCPEERLIVSRGVMLSTESPALLCALIGLPAAAVAATAWKKEPLFPIGQTGTRLNVAQMLISLAT